MNLWLILLCAIIFVIICSILYILPWLILKYKCKKEKKLVLKEFERNTEIQNEQLQWNSIFHLKIVLSSKKKKPESKKDILPHFLFPEKKLTKDIILKKGYLPHFVKYLKSESPLVQSKAAETLAYIVNELPNEYMEAIAETQIIPTLIQILISTEVTSKRRQKNPFLHMAFINILPHFVSRFSGFFCKKIRCEVMNENVLDQIILTLGTFVRTQPKLQKLYNDSNIIASLFEIALKEKIFSEDNPSPRLQNIAVIICCLCQNNDDCITAEKQSFAVIVIPVMSKLIKIYEPQIIQKLYQKIFELIKNKKATVYFDKNIIDSCFELLNEEEEEDLKTSALVTLTFMSFDKNALQHFIEKGILENIKAALKSDRENLECIKPLKSAHGFQILSNLTTQNTENIQLICDANFVPEIIDFLATEIDEAHIVAIYPLIMIAKDGTIENISTLMEFNIMQILCKFLQNPSSKDKMEIQLHSVALFIVDSIIEKIADESVLLEIEKYNGIKLIEKFLNHDNEMIKTLAQLICENSKNLRN